MELEGIMQSEISQGEKDKYFLYDCTCVWDLKKLNSEIEGWWEKWEDNG